MANIGIGQQNLIDLIETRENSYKLFKYQMSQLTNEGKDLYIDYLKRNLTEEKIDKILQKYFSSHYTEKGIEQIVQLKKPFIKLEPLANEEIHKSNEQFLKRKYNNLIKIYNEVNEIGKEEIIENKRIEIIAETFLYRHKDKDPNLNCLADLYSNLIINGFIQDTSVGGNNLNKWKKIFRGGNEEIELSNRIIWIGSNFQLKRLIDLLSANHIITVSFHKKWQVTANCFSKYKKGVESSDNRIEYKASTFSETSKQGNYLKLKKLNNYTKELMGRLGIAEKFNEIIRDKN